MFGTVSRGFGLAAFTVALTISANLWGQAGSPNQSGIAAASYNERAGAQDPRVLLQQAHQLAKQAKTVEEFTRALRLCQQAKKLGVTRQTEEYLRDLAGWLYNRRGEAYADQAGLASEQGDSQRSAQLEDQAIRDFTTSLNFKVTWRPFHNRGVSKAMQGDYEAAIGDFDESIARNPDYGNTFFNRAEILFEMGRFDEAERDYSEAIRLNPADAVAISGRGHAMFQQGRVQEAVDDFSEVIRLEPENARALADRGDVYAYAGEWNSAALDYKAAQKLNSEFGRVYQSMAWIAATCPDDYFRNPEMALKLAKTAIRLDGQDDYRYLDTLAAAQASYADELARKAQESSDRTAQQQSVEGFQKAVEYANQAASRAPADVRPDIEQRVAAYRQRQPFREVR